MRRHGPQLGPGPNDWADLLFQYKVFESECLDLSKVLVIWCNLVDATTRIDKAMPSRSRWQNITKRML